MQCCEYRRSSTLPALPVRLHRHLRRTTGHHVQGLTKNSRLGLRRRKGSRPTTCPAVPDPDWVPHGPASDTASVSFSERGVSPVGERAPLGTPPADPSTAAARVHEPTQQAHVLPQAASAAQMPHPASATAPASSLGPAALIFMLGAATAGFVQGLMRTITGTAAAPDAETAARPAAPPPPDAFGADSPLLPPRNTPAPSTRQESILPDSESVEWVNMCVRKIWRVYQRGLENWISGLLQPVFDTYINEDTPPTILRRIRIARFTLNHEPPCFDSMQRRNSRKESDLNAVCSVRYSGGAKMLLVLELGGQLSGVEIPVMVEDFDLDARMWIKLRLAPMCPWIGVISVAFVEQPRIQVQLNTYGMLPLMRIPVLQRFLRKLLTVELPGIMVLPQRLEINLPPSVTVLAEAAVGRDTVMRAVASAVLQADAMEQALYHALPMDAANVASAVTVPEAFVGELTITIVEGRNLPVWGFPWQSNPYCRIVIGSQAVDSKRERETGSRGSFRCPNWNQEFQFLVEDSPMQTVKFTVYDSPYTGRVDVGYAQLRLDDLPQDGTLHKWLPVFCAPTYTETQGELFVRASYRAFDEVADEDTTAEAAAAAGRRGVVPADVEAPSITDVQSAAEASARAAVEASQGLEALAVAKAAAARAAARLRGRREGSDAESASSGSSAEEEGSETGSGWPPTPRTSALASLDDDSGYAEQLVRAVRGQQERRDAQTAALATELGQRAVARVTGKSTPPTDQATLKRRVDNKIAAQDAAKEAPAAAEAGSPAGSPRAPDAGEGADRPKDAAFKRTYVDFDLVAEGDGTTTSVTEVQSTHLQQLAEERRGRAPPLLPGGLPGPQGRALDELMERGGATTRLRSVDTIDLVELKSPGGGGPDKAAAPSEPAQQAQVGGRDGGSPRGDGKRVVVSDGQGHVIHPELSIQSDSAIATGELEQIADVLPRGPLPELDGGDQKPPAPPRDGGAVAARAQSNGAEDGGAEQPAQPARSAAESAELASPEALPEGQALLEKTVDLVDDVAANGADVSASEASDGSGDTAKPEAAGEDQSRPWWKFGWGVEDSFSEPPPDADEHERAQRDRRWRRHGDAEVSNRAAGAEEQGEGEFWGWAKGMAILAGLKRSREGADGDAAPDTAKPPGTSTDSDTSQSGKEKEGDQAAEERAWWDGLMDIWKRDEEPKAGAKKSAGGGRGGTANAEEERALSTVIVSPDVPIEEIAAEIARVKQQTAEQSAERRRREGEDMLMGPVGQLQRLSAYLVGLNKPEIVLLCGLCGGVMVLLAVVAYRIELYMELIRALDSWR